MDVSINHIHCYIKLAIARVAESNLTFAQGVDMGVLRVRRLRMHAVLILRVVFH